MPSAAAPEVPLWLVVNGHYRSRWSGSPADPETLFLGHLLTAGYVQSPEQLQGLEIVEEPAGCIGARATVPEQCAERVAEEREHMQQVGCGVRHFSTCAPDLLPRARLLPLPQGDVLAAAFRALFTATDAAWPEGGMHAAALWDGERLLPPAFDVGRHNAVDRALGDGARRRVELARTGLVLSSRISGEIALKAARVGLGFIASRSIPTTLAAELCAAVGLPIAARAGRGGRGHRPEAGS